MKKLLIALFVLLFVVATLSIFSITERFRERTYSELVADKARAAAIQRKYEVDTRLYEEWAPRLAGLVVILLAISGVLTIAYLAGLGAAHVRSKWTTTRPDRRGLLPVAHGDNEAAVAALIAYHNARIAEAMRQPVPERLHYAPRVDYRIPASAETHRVLSGDVAQTVNIPSFADLLTSGRIGRGRALCLGYDLSTSECVWGDWRDLYSAGLGGQQGSGKSWTATSLVAQSLLAGAHIVLCDPHAGDAESLTTRLEPLLPSSNIEIVADSHRAIINAAQYVYEQLEQRKQAAKTSRTYSTRQLVIVIDEWTSLLRVEQGDALKGFLAAITTEGRKYGVNALILAQRWSAAAAGGSDIRNTLTSHYVHRMRLDEARLMTGIRAGVLPRDTYALQPGQAYLCDTRGNIRKVATPYMNQRDLDRVAQLLAEQHTAQSQQNKVATSSHNEHEAVNEVAGEVGKEATAEVVSNAPLRTLQNAAKWTAEELRIISALRSGKSPGQVAEELAGSRGGQKYQQAARQVADVIRRALEHIE